MATALLASAIEAVSSVVLGGGEPPPDDEIKPCVIQRLDDKKVPVSKKSYTELLATVPDSAKPIIVEPTSITEKPYATLYTEKTPYDYSTTYPEKNNINILLKLPPLSNSTEKLWLKKLSNDMKIKYIAAQVYILKSYHLRAIKALEAADAAKYKARLVGLPSQSDHYKILKSKLTNLFTNFDEEIVQTKKYMNRLNGVGQPQ